MINTTFSKNPKVSLTKELVYINASWYTALSNKGLAFVFFKLVQKILQREPYNTRYLVFLHSLYSHLSYSDWITKAFVSQMFEGQAVHRCFIVRSPAKWIPSCHLLYYPTIQQSRVKSKVESQGWYKKGLFFNLLQILLWWFVIFYHY